MRMSEHLQASQEELQATIEHMKDVLQVGVGRHVMSHLDRDREITYEDDMPIMFANGYFFFCKGEHVLRHAPVAALVLEIEPHYDLEFRYSPARLMPGYANEHDAENEIYDTTTADEISVERALLMVSSEGMMLYSLDNAGDAVEDGELQYGAELSTDLDINSDMDGNPSTSEQLIKAMERSYVVTSEICLAIRALSAALPRIQAEEDIDELNKQECVAYEEMDIF